MSPPSPLPHPSRPWYREPYVWLLIAIPAAAVLTGLITLAFAIASDDTAPENAPPQDAMSWHGPG